MRVVHPIAAENWLVQADRTGLVLGRRRSPTMGDIWDLFEEAVSIPKLAAKSRFSIACC
jgi:hypothetical protein